MGKKVKPYKVATDDDKPKAPRPARKRRKKRKGNAAHIVKPLALTGAAMGLVAATVVAVGTLESRAAALRATVRPEIEIDWPTRLNRETGEQEHLLAEAFRHSIEELAKRAVGNQAEPFSQAPLARLGRALDRSGWFDGQPVVTRGDDGLIRVRGTWRVHAAVVRYRDDDYLVTGDGRMMPVIYGPAERVHRERFIANPRFDPPRTSTGALDYARPWEGEDVKAGLALLAKLRAEPFWGQIAGVDVGTFPRDRLMTVVTDRGSRIGWGGPVGEFSPGQEPEATRLALLRRFFRDVGHIDGNMTSYDLWDATRKMEIDRTSAAPPRTLRRNP